MTRAALPLCSVAMPHGFSLIPHRVQLQVSYKAQNMGKNFTLLEDRLMVSRLLFFSCLC